MQLVRITYKFHGNALQQAERNLSLARQGALTNPTRSASPRLKAAGYGSHAGFAAGPISYVLRWLNSSRRRSRRKKRSPHLQMGVSRSRDLVSPLKRAKERFPRYDPRRDFRMANAPCLIVTATSSLTSSSRRKAAIHSSTPRLKCGSSPTSAGSFDNSTGSSTS